MFVSRPPHADRRCILSGSTYEVDADGRDVGLGVGVVRESQQQARLSDARVSDQEKFEEVVVSILLLAVRSRLCIAIVYRRNKGPVVAALWTQNMLAQRTAHRIEVGHKTLTTQDSCWAVFSNEKPDGRWYHVGRKERWWNNGVESRGG